MAVRPGWGTLQDPVKGKMTPAGKDRTVISGHSIIHVDVSGRPLDDLQGLIADAQDFLDKFHDTIMTLQMTHELTWIRLDFYYGWCFDGMNIPVNETLFPPQFLETVGKLGIGIGLRHWEHFGKEYDDLPVTWREVGPFDEREMRKRWPER